MPVGIRAPSRGELRPSWKLSGGQFQVETGGAKGALSCFPPTTQGPCLTLGRRESAFPGGRSGAGRAATRHVPGDILPTPLFDLHGQVRRAPPAHASNSPPDCLSLREPAWSPRGEGQARAWRPRRTPATVTSQSDGHRRRAPKPLRHYPP